MNDNSKNKNEKQTDKSLDYMKFALSRNSESIHRTNDIIFNLVTFIIKWLIILNGSACIALLALVGNTWGKESKIDFLATLLTPIAFMGSACITAILDAIFIYFVFGNISQYHELNGQIITKVFKFQDHSQEQVQLARKSCKAKRWGTTSIITGFISLGLSVTGCVFLICRLSKAI